MGNCCESEDKQRLNHHRVLELDTYSHMEKSRAVENYPEQDIMMTLPLNYVYKLFRDGRYIQATQMLKKHIVEYPQNKEQEIDGLGNFYLAEGYYEWFVYRHYSEGIKRGVYKGTVYDALSLCYLELIQNEQQLEKGIQWYRFMVEEHPQSPQLLFGLANILQNSGKFDEALKFYNKTAEIKPNWIKPQQCIAFIYQQDLRNGSKAVQIANKILQKDANNLVAQFIKALNEANSDLKIQHLQEIYEQHPAYVRIANQIGAVYGSEKDMPDQSIRWFKSALEKVPEYHLCYINIALSQVKKNNDKAAVEWFLKSLEWQKKYGDAHEGLQTIFTKEALTDEQIQLEIGRYSIESDYIYYNMGEVNFSLGKYEKAIKYYNKANQKIHEMKKQRYLIYNSIGLSYYHLQEYENATKYYKMSIEANPKNYLAHFNLARVYQDSKLHQEADQCFEKAIQINPKDSDTCLYLGNKLKDNSNYDESIKFYKKVIQHNPHNTLALTNMGISYFNLSNYKSGFTTMMKARQSILYDKNHLSEDKKLLLSESLEQFKNDGDTWRKNGDTQGLHNKIQANVKQLDDKLKSLDVKREKQRVAISKVLKKEIIQIVKLVHLDSYELQNIDAVYKLVEQLCKDNEEYFSIIPQLFIQNYYNGSFAKQKAFLEIQKYQSNILRRLITYNQHSQNQQNRQEENMKRQKRSQRYNKTINNLNNAEKLGINLFTRAYFQNYYELYNQILSVNQSARQNFSSFNNLVEDMVRRSHGVPSDIEVKINGYEKESLPAVLDIMSHIFKNQLATQKENITWKIDQNLKDKLNYSKNLTKDEILDQIKQTWANEITSILQQRMTDSVETNCSIHDFIKGKIQYHSFEELKSASQTLQKLTLQYNLKILEIKNRLGEKFKEDIVFLIEINGTICELHLQVLNSQLLSNGQLRETLLSIQFSPLGCIYGSYIALTKPVDYPFYQNCLDINYNLNQLKKKDPTLEDKECLEAAKYVVKTLTQK